MERPLRPRLAEIDEEGLERDPAMTQHTRPATPVDIPRLVPLLLQDAEERHALDPVLWRIAADAPARIEEALRFALTAEDQPVRQFWLVGESDGALTGVIHAMLLPVPPIYAGAFGPPGLILADSQTAADAPAGTVDALVAAAEEAMRAAGAELLLSSFVTGATWQTAFAARGYDPLTLYLSRTDLGEDGRPSGVRAATEDDVPGIVIRSAENRQVLSGIDAFWEPHPEADARFAAWMTRSLTLRDREMLVAGDPDRLEGYVIAQPASRMHFPPAHDIRGTGVVDDYFHPDFGAPAMLAEGGAGATALLRAAEAAFAARGMGAAFVVCPAGWTSKLEMLEAAGYDVAMVWSIKRQAGAERAPCGRQSS